MIKFIKEEKGQTTVEYLLIIGVVVVVISAVGKILSGPQGISAIANSVMQGVTQKVNTLMQQ